MGFTVRNCCIKVRVWRWGHPRDQRERGVHSMVRRQVLDQIGVQDWDRPLQRSGRGHFWGHTEKVTLWSVMRVRFQ